MQSYIMENKFLKKLNQGEPIVCAEGYLFELERRGYVQAGPFVPLCVLDHPEVVKQLHLDFVRAGSGMFPRLPHVGDGPHLGTHSLNFPLLPL